MEKACCRPVRRTGKGPRHERRAGGAAATQGEREPARLVLQTCHRTRRRDRVAVNFLLRMYATSLRIRAKGTRLGRHRARTGTAMERQERAAGDD